MQAGKPTQSIEQWKELVELTTKEFGLDHDRTISGLRNLAYTYGCAGQLANALPAFDRAVTIGQRMASKSGQDYPADSLQTRSKLYLSVKQYKQAEADARAAMAAFNSSPAANAAELASATTTLAQSLLGQSRLDEAETEIQKALTLFDSVEPESPDKYRAESVWGSILMARGEYAQAETHLRDSYEKLPTKLSTISIRWCQLWACKQLIELYTKWNKPDLEAKWRAELSAIQAEIDAMSEDRG